MKVILASASPRRKELMDLLNIPYEIIISQGEEIYNDSLNLEEQPKQIAYGKAKEVFDKTQGDRIVIGADTLVLRNNQFYGKPKDDMDAIRMIKEIQDGKHQVITAFAILVQKEGQYIENVGNSVTDVYLKPISDREIENWIATGKHMDKAGAYGIQEEFSVYVKRIEGSYATVLGFPIEDIYDILKEYLLETK